MSVARRFETRALLAHRLDLRARLAEEPLGLLASILEGTQVLFQAGEPLSRRGLPTDRRLELLLRFAVAGEEAEIELLRVVRLLTDLADLALRLGAKARRALGRLARVLEPRHPIQDLGLDRVAFARELVQSLGVAFDLATKLRLFLSPRLVSRREHANLLVRRGERTLRLSQRALRFVQPLVQIERLLALVLALRLAHRHGRDEILPRRLLLAMETLG